MTIKNIACEVVALVLRELFFGRRKNTEEKCPQNRVTALQAIKKNFILYFFGYLENADTDTWTRTRGHGKRGHGKRGQAYK